MHKDIIESSRILCWALVFLAIAMDIPELVIQKQAFARTANTALLASIAKSVRFVYLKFCKIMLKNVDFRLDIMVTLQMVLPMLVWLVPVHFQPTLTTLHCLVLLVKLGFWNGVVAKTDTRELDAKVVPTASLDNR